ncbi:hypothetical protein [Natrinema sp. 1APR25-10V2]|uniref:hypothetical protein n=1 Tax=Natrinema sp. 1APR25-10V2 TaxID=2951081 RepID=UPI0028767912|nr:hypothetical protein [Natrinema sp. 1APR25-10V2]MDS0474523.1 hypothetical protein [Natrinema sp. 1APR25-10V2]
MALDDVLAQVSELLEGDKITGRQAGLIIFVWMGAVALFGLISYIVVFIIIGF